MTNEEKSVVTDLSEYSQILKFSFHLILEQNGCALSQCKSRCVFFLLFI